MIHHTKTSVANYKTSDATYNTGDTSYKTSDTSYKTCDTSYKTCDVTYKTSDASYKTSGNRVNLVKILTDLGENIHGTMVNYSKIVMGQGELFEISHVRGFTSR